MGSVVSGMRVGCGVAVMGGCVGKCVLDCCDD